MWHVLSHLQQLHHSVLPPMWIERTHHWWSPNRCPPQCINCKGSHASSHKECNTRQIRMGLKPIPAKSENTHKKNQNNQSQEQPQKMNHRRREKGKGKEIESTWDTAPPTENIGLSNADITSLLANNLSQVEQCKHTARLIHNQAKEKLTIKILACRKQNNQTPTGTGLEMDVDDHQMSNSQWIHTPNRNQL